jgi:hypothetical protein
LSGVEERLVALAREGASDGLTEPDPGGTERWRDVEVWAHLGEFPDYWVDQLSAVVGGRGGKAVPFGRTKADPARTAAVAAARRDDIAGHLRRLLGACDRLRALFATMDDADWAARGAHPSLGEMDVPSILQEFLIGHLEQHAAQLEALHGR